MNQEREIVALHDLRTYDLSSNTDQFGVLKIADILNAPGLGRYTKRFDRIRFLKLKIDFFRNELHTYRYIDSESK